MFKMLFRSVWLVLIVAGIGCGGSGSEDTGDSPALPPEAPAISLDGTVTYVDLEGGFYGINGDDGQAYLPSALDPHFRQDGLRVRFKARTEPGMTAQQWGIPVRIVLISTL